LRRLGVDRIDLYQLHTVDRRTPFEESVGALADLRREGKVRHIGLSNVSIDELERARTIVPVVSVQNRYNVVDRGAEDVLRYCDRQGIAFICWLPLARGTLGRHAGRLRDMAIAYGATPSQLVLAWLLQRSPRAVPIPGTSSVAHLEENVGALDLQLSAEDVRALDEFRLDRVTLLLGAARKGRRRTLARLRRLQPPRGR
jgi:aryl-alcohol dehydrogenase-like predicted oxidoreductase